MMQKKCVIALRFILGESRMDNTEVNLNSNQLEELRKARGISNTAFIKFTDNYDKFSSHIFCFYEGEDGKYYNQRLQSIIGNKIIPIITGNKVETLKVWRRIKKDSKYDYSNKMFFVDRDMDDIPDDIDSDLYITPCYSIENLYVNSNAFGDILQSEFSCTKIDKDYLKCINMFEKLYTQFNNEIFEFNALVLLRRRKNLGCGKVRLSDIKTHQLISINIDGINKGIKYDELITDLINKLNTNKYEIEATKKEIEMIGNYGNNFRGKNQLDFMVSLINILKQLHNDGKFFEKKNNCVTITLTGNRLSELSQYADFPKCLKTFIENHKIKA